MKRTTKIVLVATSLTVIVFAVLWLIPVRTDGHVSDGTRIFGDLGRIRYVLLQGGLGEDQDFTIPPFDTSKPQFGNPRIYAEMDREAIDRLSKSDWTYATEQGLEGKKLSELDASQRIIGIVGNSKYPDAGVYADCLVRIKRKVNE